MVIFTVNRSLDHSLGTAQTPYTIHAKMKKRFANTKMGVGSKTY